MSMIDYITAASLVKNCTKSHFIRDIPDPLIQDAENALGLRFPTSYRRFLNEFGFVRLGGTEIYGVTRSDFQNARIPNGIWLTLDERKSGLPGNFILIYDADDGVYYALDTSKHSDDGENPVVALNIEFEIIEIIASDFGKFFLDIITWQLEREN
jgi:antitoxin YobK